MIIGEVRMKKRDLSVAWIDYKKVYDMVPNSCKIDCLETIGIHEKDLRHLAESMESSQLELISGEKNMRNGNIRRRIFHDDSLSPLLLVARLLPLTYILRDAAPGYYFGSSEQKVNHRLFMDDLKIYVNNEKSHASLI